MLNISVLLFSLDALADELDTFNIVAGVNRQYDDNVFRVSSDRDMRTVAGRKERWDNITTGFAGVRFDKQYSLQRFKADYTRTAYRYQNYDYLDFDANEYKLAWLWALTPYLTGNLSSDRTESLNNFQDYRDYRATNIRTTRSHRFDIDWTPHGNWHLLAGISYFDLRNSQVFNEQSDYSQDSVNAGLKYVFPSGSAMGVMLLGKKGENNNLISNFFDANFDERETNATLDWVLTGKSRISSKLGYLDREYENLSNRDYSGVFGNISYIWLPTAKLQIVTTASRELASFQTFTSSYTVMDTFAVSPSWLISDKLSLQMSASLSDRRFDGNSVLGLPDINRKDRGKALSLSFSWKPWRSVTLGGSLQHSARESTESSLDFSDNSASLSAQLFF